VTYGNNRNDRPEHSTNTSRNEAKKARRAVLTLGVLVLAREHWWRSVSMSGFARRRVSNIRSSGEHRAFGAPMNRNCTLWTLRVAWLKALSLLRFFVALDKEMTCRHAQWLTVIKKLAKLSRPLTLKAATRHQLRPLTPEPGNPASTPTTTPQTRQNPKPVHRCERKKTRRPLYRGGRVFHLALCQKEQTVIQSSLAPDLI